jgi:hypothetical protein
MKALRIHIARSLLVLFGLILVPHELIHNFFGHEDTHCHSGVTATFEAQHFHCKILQLEAPMFTSPEPDDLVSVNFYLKTIPVERSYSLPSFSILYNDLRAPPKS